jgi:Gas vesicle synthesis protein GvpL/GvpF
MTAQSASRPVYVYGVVPAGGLGPLSETGVADRPLELVEHDGLAAVVSDFPSDDTRVRRRDLLAHLSSIERIFGESIVAPCAFGTVMSSRDDVERKFLAPRRDELRALLKSLDGHVQMNVKAEYEEQAIIREIVATEPEIARARERSQRLGDAAYYENIRLGELVAASVQARRATDADEIATRLGAAATEAVVDPPRTELSVFKGSFLVVSERLQAFDEALDSLAEAGKERLRFESFGPLPPTAFATLRAEG